MERDAIIAALDQTKNNKYRASDILGISIRTLRNKMNLYGLYYLKGDKPFKRMGDSNYHWGN